MRLYDNPNIFEDYFIYILTLCTSKLIAAKPYFDILIKITSHIKTDYVYI